MVDSIEKEFLDFIDRKGGDKNNIKSSDQQSSESGELTSRSMRGNDRGAKRGDPLARGSSHGGPKGASGGGRRGLLTKSLSKEDLKVEPVNDFFAEFEDEEFAVDWEDPDALQQQEDGGANSSTNKPDRKANLARSRRLGPGDRRKEVIRRNSSRRVLADSAHGDGGGGRSRSNSAEGDDDFGFNRRGLNRRASNRSLMSSDSNSKRDVLTEKSHSKRDLSAEKPQSKRDLFAEKTPTGDDGFGELPQPSGKMTVKSLREDLKDGSNDMEMSFSDFPKEWQVSSNPAVASFLPTTQRDRSNKAPSNNPRHRRNSLNSSASRPQMQRRLSSRGGALMQDGHDDASAAHRTPRRHSLMGETQAGDGMNRQRSNRNLASGGGDEAHSGSRRTTTIPRRMSMGGGSSGCRELGGRRPSVSSNTTNMYTGETIAAMGGATIKW